MPSLEKGYVVFELICLTYNIPRYSEFRGDFPDVFRGGGGTIVKEFSGILGSYVERLKTGDDPKINHFGDLSQCLSKAGMH